MSDIWLLAALVFAAAVLYSSVGHAGASGYLAAMALFGLAPAQMRPAALILNVIVASIGTVRFYRAGCFSWRLFLPFTAASVPLAALGGYLTLPTNVYRPIVGVVLLLSALRLVATNPNPDPAQKRGAPLWAALVCGGGIGLLSGLTGTGGGIFLSPLLLFMRWAETKEAAGVAVAFILANSVAGLVGLMAHSPTLPAGIGLWAVAAALGGLVGSEFGSKHLGNRALRRLLALVLVVAGLKMVLALGAREGAIGVLGAEGVGVTAR
ncbi:MAG: sulfite exporter TauE/SafE family protein [Planctomycetes bacterium]|nr:sulfite exporter TauE/SafE family protein [Planctomycetota bacterium]